MSDVEKLERRFARDGFALVVALVALLAVVPAWLVLHLLSAWML
jgi:hypothetical protein